MRLWPTRERCVFIGTQFSNIYAVPVRAERARESRNYVRAVVSTVERGGRLMRASLAAPAPFDCSPRAVQNEALLTKARNVIECMQRRWLNATFCQWADRAQTRSTDGVAEGPVIMIVKKANSAVQRSARPDAVQPDEESMKERDEHAALEEMGTTMRVQQEQIERLKQEAKDENMRCIAKEYQWKEVGLYLRRLGCMLGSCTAVWVLHCGFKRESNRQN